MKIAFLYCFDIQQIPLWTEYCDFISTGYHNMTFSDSINLSPQYSIMSNKAYRWNYATGSDTAADTHPTVVVRIVIFFQEILMSYVIWHFIDHEAATLHSDGVAMVEIGVEICAVAAALITMALEIPLLIKNYLEYKAMVTLLIRIV